MSRLREFLDEERDFESATALEDYVVAVTVRSDGSVIDELGNCFEPDED